MKTKMCKNIYVVFIAVLMLSISQLSAAPQSKSTDNTKKTAISVDKLGGLALQKSDDKQTFSSLLVLKTTNNKPIVLDSYIGLEPFELQKTDLDNDGRIEIIATLKYPDSENLIPYVYTLNLQKNELLEKIFPVDDNESKLLNCREVYFNSKGNQQNLYLKYIVNYHEYGPPELFRLEKYHLENGKIILDQIRYNEGNHYNQLMNLGTEYLYKGKSKEAAEIFNKTLTSCSSKMNKKAICETIFLNAEALKYSGNYSNAMKLFEKLVLEYTDSPFTEIAQNELEFLAENTKDPKNIKLMEQFFAVLLEIEYEHSSEALNHLNQLIVKNKNCNFMDRLLYIKAELLISENRVEEAIAVFNDLKEKFPNSSLIEIVDEMMENLESKPEDIEGL